MNYGEGVGVCSNCHEDDDAKGIRLVGFIVAAVILFAEGACTAWVWLR